MGSECECIDMVHVKSLTFLDENREIYDLYAGNYSAGSNVWSNTIISDKEQSFVDYKGGDFTLSDECSIFKYTQPEVFDTVMGIEDGEIWFEKIDFKKIGIQS